MPELDPWPVVVKALASAHNKAPVVAWPHAQRRVHVLCGIANPAPVAPALRERLQVAFAARFVGAERGGA